MWEYIVDIIMWIVTAIVVTFAINKTGTIDALIIYVIPVAITFFKGLSKLN